MSSVLKMRNQDQPSVRRRGKMIQFVDRDIAGWEMCRDQRGVSRGQAQPQTERIGQIVVQIGGQTLKRVMHQPALNLRGDPAGLFVHGHDAARMNRLGILFVEDLVLRIRELESAVSPHLGETEQHDALTPGEDVAQERLVQPRRPQRPAWIADERLEDLEPRTPGRAEAAAQDAPRHGRGLTRLERRNRLQMTAILVAKREPVQQIFNRGQAGVSEIGRAPGTDALEELQWRREDVV